MNIFIVNVNHPVLTLSSTMHLYFCDISLNEFFKTTELSKYMYNNNKLYSLLGSVNWYIPEQCVHASYCS